MLKQRIIFGALGIVLAIAVLTLCPVYIIGICMSVIAFLALYEFYKVTGLFSKKSPMAYIGIAFCIIVCAMSVCLGADALFYVGLPVLAFVFLLMLANVFFSGKTTLSDAALSFLGSVYITLFFAHLYFVRLLEHGSILIWLLFVSAWATDSFAYFSGMGFGKHKLCPSISPKKTVEGAVGGVLGCVLIDILFLFVISKFNEITLNYINATVLALTASVFSQIGDLVASRIKREYNVKDFGNLIPGHGGILDRFDSALLISPVVFYMLLILPVIN